MLGEDEIDLLLSDLLKLYGYDFYYYSRDSLKRRISKIFRLEKFASFNEFRSRIKTDPGYIEHLIDRLTVNVTQMFRDNDCFMALRETVLPTLAELPEIHIWHAGCSTGEEVYSMAILLHETGLLKKSVIYATDINPLVIEKAKAGAYPISLMKLYEKNYINSGGKSNFSDYYSDNGANATIKQFLAENIRFIPHNLASGLTIGKFNIVLCRNVIIYFDNELRERVFQLFNNSLLPKAFLVLGEKENLRSDSIAPGYIQIVKEKIWKKLK